MTKVTLDLVITDGVLQEGGGAVTVVGVRFLQHLSDDRLCTHTAGHEPAFAECDEPTRHGAIRWPDAQRNRTSMTLAKYRCASGASSGWNTARPPLPCCACMNSTLVRDW
jgi:hypothetical protein